MQPLRYVKVFPQLRRLCQPLKLIWADRDCRGDDLLQCVERLRANQTQSPIDGILGYAIAYAQPLCLGLKKLLD